MTWSSLASEAGLRETRLFVHVLSTWTSHRRELPSRELLRMRWSSPESGAGQSETRLSVRVLSTSTIHRQEFLSQWWLL